MKEEGIVVMGTVLEQYAGDRFLVELDDGRKINIGISGKIRKNFIRITPGDKVDVSLSVYDINSGRIIFRYKK
jgi:translation initiation factor IF-1